MQDPDRSHLKGRAKPKPSFERVQIPIEQLVENPRNPRSHPDKQIAGLVASLRKFGQTKPLLARRANNMLIAGHGVFRAMQAATITIADVILWDVDQQVADEYMLADNEHGKHASDDLDRVAELLRDIAPEDFAAVGFDQAGVDKLLADLQGGAIDVVEMDVTEVSDRFWIAVRGPLADQAKALKRIRELMADMPHVEVELGTVMQG